MKMTRFLPRRPRRNFDSEGLKKHDGFYIPIDAVTDAPKHPTESKEKLYGTIIKAVRLALRYIGSPIIVRNHERIPLAGGAVIAVNHTSYPDFVFAGAPAFIHGRRVVRYLAKKEVFDVAGPLRKILRTMRHIPVDREAGRSALDEAITQCKEGDLVGIFPEGTISRTFNLRPLKSGAARIAQQAGVPLIPVALWGSQRLWTKDWPRDLGRKKYPVIVKVGEPVPTDGTYEEIAERLYTSLSALIDDIRAEYAERFGPIPDGEWWMPADLGGGAPDAERAELLHMAEAERRAARRAARKAKKKSQK